MSLVCWNGGGAKERRSYPHLCRLKPLNQNVDRLPKVDETLAQMSGGKVFSKLDTNSGFWQIPPHYLHYSVQTVLPISNAAALKLTTARYFTPSGRSIQVSGIEPDIVISRVKVESLEEETHIITEENLTRHLDNDTQDDAMQETTDGDEATAEQIKARLLEDYTLQQALNVLKSLQILTAEAE